MWRPLWFGALSRYQGLLTLFSVCLATPDARITHTDRLFMSKLEYSDIKAQLSHASVILYDVLCFSAAELTLFNLLYFVYMNIKCTLCLKGLWHIL